MGKLDGKAAIITGSAKGIGRAIAEAFAKHGADLLLITRSTPLDRLAETCRAHGSNVECITADISDPAQALAAIETCKDVFGKVDILVNNAGIARDGLLVRMKDHDFELVLKTNLTGSFNCLRAATKIMMKQRYGRIINISSVAGQMGYVGQINYSAAKAGLIGMTKSAAKELASRSITVNAIAPGFIATDMTNAMSDRAKEEALKLIPMGRLGDVDDIAAGALFLASDDAAYVTGHTLSINGGMYM